MRLAVAAAAAGDGEEGEDGGAEEECAAEFQPLVQLDEVEVQVLMINPACRQGET